MPVPSSSTDPKGFYEYSIRIQELERIKRISRYSVKREVKRKALSLEELSAILKASRGDHPVYFFIWCYACFGLRRNESLKLTVKDVNFDENKLEVRASITKSMPRYFYFDDETKRVLKDALDYYGVERAVRAVNPTNRTNEKMNAQKPSSIPRPSFNSLNEIP